MPLETETPVAEGCEHIVQFYETPAELAGEVAAYLRATLELGGGGLILATPQNVAAIEARLTAAGIDVPGALADGRLVHLDAAGTLGAMTRDGAIDARAFDESVGAPLRRLVQAHGPLRAFGEMVGLLWEANDVVGAIELERLWNELAAHTEFSLLCGYSAGSVADPENFAALEQICALHTSVLQPARLAAARRAASADGASGEGEGEGAGEGAGERAREFPADHTAVAQARRFVSECLREWDPHRVLADNALLVVSELATNAVVHARSPFSVVASCDGTALRLAVRDRSPVRPVMSAVEPTGVSGRGLRIVEALARDWGVEEHDDGKAVWAEMARA